MFATLFYYSRMRKLVYDADPAMIMIVQPLYTITNDVVQLLNVITTIMNIINTTIIQPTR